MTQKKLICHVMKGILDPTPNAKQDDAGRRCAGGLLHSRVAQKQVERAIYVAARLDKRGFSYFRLDE